MNEAFRTLMARLASLRPQEAGSLTMRTATWEDDDVILGAAEIGVVAFPQPRAGLDVLPFRDDKLTVICSPSHALAQKQKVSLAALAAVPQIGFDREAPTRKGIERLFRDKGLDYAPVMEMDNVETIKRAVELGLGVALVPAATVQHELTRGTLVARPLADGAFTRPIGLLVRKGKYLDRASSAVLEAFKAAASSEELFS